MMLAFLHWLAARLPHRLITGEDGTPYLSRFRVFGWMPGDPRRWPFSIYLHRFHRRDLDDAPHSHPWKWAVSLVLAGGYTEGRPDYQNGKPLDHDGAVNFRRLRPGRTNFLRHDTFHVVTELHGVETWTLFIVGPKSASWGFLVSGRGVVPWRDRLRERGIEAQH